MIPQCKSTVVVNLLFEKKIHSHQSQPVILEPCPLVYRRKTRTSLFIPAPYLDSIHNLYSQS